MKSVFTICLNIAIVNMLLSQWKLNWTGFTYLVSNSRMRPSYEQVKIFDAFVGLKSKPERV